MIIFYINLIKFKNFDYSKIEMYGYLGRRESKC